MVDDSFGSGVQWSAATVCWRTSVSNLSYCCWQGAIVLLSPTDTPALDYHQNHLELILSWYCKARN